MNFHKFGTPPSGRDEPVALVAYEAARRDRANRCVAASTNSISEPPLSPRDCGAANVVTSTASAPSRAPPLNALLRLTVVVKRSSDVR